MSLDTTAPPQSTARLSYSDFEVAIRAFLKQAEHQSPWSYIEYRPRSGQPLRGYLAMNQHIHCPKSTSSLQPNSQQPEQRTAGSREVGPEDQLILDDLAEHFGAIPDEYDDDDNDDELGAVELLDLTSTDFLTVSFHIIFSPSYQVPVLYFNAYRHDGTAIALEEIYESLVPEAWRSSIRNAGINGGISQQDHPILNVPYFYMHPCETVPLMETIVLSQAEASNSKSFIENYIMTWLSFTGQAIGISVPAIVATRVKEG
ncbi:hypothetical protein KVV02_005648 [Mortierella alpina]|uniref:Ubiquitin-like-conjugating enzyme ATG10 n=1 Tax=Mortierella alpina TaxID=64518 RepID=A0A9P8A7H3_MORAP|nr:hypothetical protein KVV02_005648 [Mortierella alpina]